MLYYIIYLYTTLLQNNLPIDYVAELLAKQQWLLLDYHKLADKGVQESFAYLQEHCLPDSCRDSFWCHTYTILCKTSPPSYMGNYSSGT